MYRSFFATLVALTLLPVAASSQQIGDECSPGDPPLRPGISCQATDEFTYHEPYLLNAKKGDALVSSSCGRVGAMLRQLPERQQFDHAGMMVQDRVELRHSTAAEQRYLADIWDDGLPDGFVPETLQIGWPGTITQSVYEAFEGEWVTDPVDGTPYRLGIFENEPETCDGDSDATFPSVVKPPFDQETMTLANTGEPVRQALRRAADQALLINGHYRPYGYTESDLLGRLQGPGSRVTSSPAWAMNQGRLDGTMCSQFVWGALRAASLPLEDAAREEGDRDHVGSPNLNGLYQYPADDRSVAAEWIYNEVYNEAYEFGGILGALLDIPDNAGNQTVNCFAFDWCGEEQGVEWDGESNPMNSDRWRQLGPGAGVTVSPQDMTQWDLPTGGGVYGLTEPMRYRMGSYKPRHRWAASPGTGELEVSVVFGGMPFDGVPVMLDGFDPQITDSSAGPGTTLFVAVPVGQYWLEAVTDFDTDGDGALEEINASRQVTVTADATGVVTLSLTPDPQQPSNTTVDHRRITLLGNIRVRDDDSPDPDDVAYCLISDSYVIDPVIQSTRQFEFSCCSDEVRGEVRITAILNPSDGDVSVLVRPTLFEAGDCNNDDNDGQALVGGDIPYDGVETFEAIATNGEWASDDSVRVLVQVTNERNTSP